MSFQISGPIFWGGLVEPMLCIWTAHFNLISVFGGNWYLLMFVKWYGALFALISSLKNWSAALVFSAHISSDFPDIILQNVGYGMNMVSDIILCGCGVGFPQHLSKP